MPVPELFGDVSPMGAGVEELGGAVGALGFGDGLRRCEALFDAAAAGDRNPPPPCNPDLVLCPPPRWRSHTEATSFSTSRMQSRGSHTPRQFGEWIVRTPLSSRDNASDFRRERRRRFARRRDAVL